MGLRVVEDVAVLRVALEAPAGAVGDVAEVAEQGALVALLDLAVGLGPLADRVEEVGLVPDVAAGAADRLDGLAVLCRRSCSPPPEIASEPSSP